MKHRMLWHRGIALILALLLAMSSLAGLPQTVRAESTGEDGPETPAQAVADAAPDVGTEVSGVLQDDPSAELPALVTEGYQSGDRVRIIVETENEPLAESAVAFADGALTTQGLRMQQTAKSRHEALANEIAAIQKQENSGAAATVRYDYTLLLDGFAVECDYGCLEEIRALPGVRDAYVAEQYELPTTPQMSSSNQMIGSAAAWGAGYDGSGMVVAVLDTGIDTDHDAFAVDPKTPSMTKQSVQMLLAQQELNAEKRKSISTDQVYLSAKLPFVFDYADNDTDVNHHGGSYHGTHVAGTIAGNPADGTISGVAPQAQLVIMKVFSDSGTNAYSDDILAALEDCLKLGVDAINMSLGSVAGFTSRPDQLATMNVYDNLEKAGIVVAAAAGNEYSAAYKNMWDTNKSLTSNPDYGVVGSPSSYLQAFSVASVDNQLVESNYFQVGDRKISFTDTAKSYAPGKEFVTQLGGKTLSYVLIPGVGKAEDYGALDVTGKIAVVSRGDTTFADKYAVAEQKGAAGCIIYNNEPGLINMSIESYTIPAIFIDKADGDAMIAAAKDGVGTLTVHTDTYQAVSSTGGLPSDFSSWGTTADLTITPDLMAPGGNIYSAEDNNTYGLMSGTSMATPHIAGAAALMLQYLRSTTDLKGRDAMDRAYALMMSTAGPAKDAGGATASPRKQGAGLVNLNAAISTDAYLSVEGNSRPKLELGEDEEQTGVYTLTFSVNNTSKQTLEYAISPVILTENAENGGTYNGQDVYFAAQTARDITADCTWTASTGTTVTVPAGDSTKVTLTVTLSDKIKEELKKTFVNGIYVEGYVQLLQKTTAEGDTGVNLSLPWLAFFGDWDKAPIVDTGYYWEKLNGDPNWGSQYLNYGGSMIKGTTSFYTFGANPYDSGLPYYSVHNTLSPLRADGYFDAVNLIYTSLLRGARSLTYSIRNADTGESYFQQTVDYVSKSVYSSTYQTVLPAGAFTSNAMTAWSGTDSTGEPLPEGTTVIVRIDAELDHDGYEAEKNVNSGWEFPVTIDNTVPEILSASSDGKTLSVTVKDNRYLAYVEAYDADDLSVFAEPLARYGFSEQEPGKEATVQFNVNGVDTVLLGAADYGRNEKLVRIDAKTGAITTETEFDYTVDDGEVTITGYTGSSVDAVIPDTLMGYPVTGIADKAFQLDKILKTVTIGKNVRSVGKQAFSRCGSMTAILVADGNESFTSKDGVLYTADGKTLVAYPTMKPDTSYQVAAGTETIAPYAMYFAKAETVTLPDSLTTLGENALGYAGNLTTVNLPSSLKTIGKQAFFNCTALKQVVIPASVTEIGEGAWAACGSLKAIETAADQTGYKSVDGILFTADGKTLVAYPNGMGLTAYTVPDGVETVYGYAFYSASTLASLTMADSVTAVGDYGFYYCGALTEPVWSKNLSSIGDYAFYSCKKILSLTFPDSMRTVGKYAFAWCSGVKTVDMGSGMREIGPYSFYYMTGMTAVKLGSGMKTVGNYAFYKDSKLATVDLGGTEVIGASAFSGDKKIAALTVPATMREIGAYAFNKCTGLTSLTLEPGVKTIEAYAFSGCSKIPSLTIPDTVTAIGNSAFSQCSAMAELKLSPATKSYGNGVFSYCSKLTSVVLPDGLTAVVDSMFMQCANLASVTIPDSVTAIGPRAFGYCKNLPAVTIPEGVTVIDDYAFNSCAKLTSLRIPNKVTRIGKNAFYGATALTALSLGSSVETIDNFAFYNCKNLPVVMLPDSVKTLGTSAFNRCEKMQTITFGTGLESIGGMCFNYCGSLEAYVVPEANAAFTGRDGILYNKEMTVLVSYPQGKKDKTYDVPGTVTEFAAYAIYTVPALEQITLPEGLTTLNELSMADDTALGAIHLPKSVTFVHYRALEGCTAMPAIEVDPDNGAYCSIDGVLFDKAAETLVYYPQGRTTDLYVVPDGVTAIGQNAFNDCAALGGIRTNDVKAIGIEVFRGDKNLKYVDLSDTVETVDAGAFYNCSGITTLTGTKALREIGANAFYSCSSLTYVLLPAVTLLGETAFNYCNKVTRVAIGPDIQTIMSGAFNNCKALEQVYFLGGVPGSISTKMFVSKQAGMTVYYDAARASEWAPNGETTWAGLKIAPTTFHTVLYRDVNHQILLEQPVGDGHAAIVPPVPERPGLTFLGWSEDASSVTADMDIIARYEGVSDVVKVTASAGANGTITPAGETEYFYESKAVYEMTPAEGYHVASVLVDGVYVGTMSAYTFDSLTEDRTIAVTFARTEHMVTYVDGLNGQTVAILYAEDGGSVIPPQAPAHTGYTFSGWSADSDNITADTVITANYETANCTVTFLDRDGGIISTVSVPYGTAAMAPEAPAVDGMTFLGWSADLTNVTADMTVKAVYAAEGAPTVTFADWDGTVLASVPANGAVTAPQVPGRTGYTFTGWDKDFAAATTDLIVTAQYQAETYQVIFLAADGTELSRQTVTYGADAEAPAAPVLEGKTFSGWDGSFTAVSRDLTLRATYIGNVYTVTFVDREGNVLSNQYIAHGGAAQAPAAPEVEGYTFTGWDADVSKITASVTVHPKYEINRFTVEFRNWDGTVLSTQTVDYGTDAVPPTAERKGYVFTGWDGSWHNVKSDLVLTAQFRQLSYTVVFVDGLTGETLKTETVLSGESAQAPEVPAHEGHVFMGWDEDFSQVYGDLVVTAQYEFATCKVTFVDGLTGEQIAVATVPYGAAAEKPDAPTHDGYVFLGWDTDTACVKEDLTVIALYEKQDVPTDPTRPTDPEKPENPTEPTKPGTDSEPQTPPTGDGAAPRLAALAGCAALLAAGLMLQSRKRKRQS